MKKTNKILSVLLVIAILLSVFAHFPVSVSAANKTIRDTVLILDDSGSMEGEPMEHLIDAAEKFCESVLNASGTNRVAIITYNSEAYLKSDFTDNITALQTAINAVDEYGMTNIYDALSIANDLLNSSTANVKNIVLMSDGLPTEGTVSLNGKYDYDDYSGYDYANAVYEQAVSYHPYYYIYTLGFFHNVYGDTKAFASQFMQDLQNAGYYEVDKVEELQFTFGEIAEEITETKITGTFNFPDSFYEGERDASATYYYADEYFYASSMEYNPSLATMSLCLAMSAFGSENVESYENKSTNVKNLMKELMFEEFEVSESFRIKPTADSIAAAIGHKKIQDNDGDIYTLIAVTVRGGGYEQEWASNFTLGKTGNHQGFTYASEQVVDFIEEYISSCGLEGQIKLWITGYSRAAATANLVAGALDSGTSLDSDVTLAKTDLYAYCFETPAGLCDKKAIADEVTYGNIFNIINPNDIVTKVAPVTMGFGRYGIDKVLPTRESKTGYKAQYEAMMKQYNALENTTRYTVDDFKYYKVDLRNAFNKHKVVYEANDYMSMGAFLDDFLYKMVTDHISRNKFVDDLQEGVREVCKFVYCDDEKVEEAVDIFISKITDVDALVKILLMAMWDKDLALGEITDLLKESFSEAGVVDIDDIKVATIPLLNIVLQYAINNINDIVSVLANENYSRIFPAHFPELCLAWLQSMDENYITDKGNTFSSGSYRIIRINCPVDVNVYDMQGTLVASIIDNQAKELGTSISSFVNADGEKTVYLPPDADYEIEIIGTDTGMVSYSVNEFSYEIGCINRLVNYYDIPIEKDRTLTAMVPAYNITYLENGTAEGTNTNYELTDDEGNVLTPDLDVSGEEAINSRHNVIAVSENEDHGIVSGSGIRQTGNYAMVIAVPQEGYSFEGWYVKQQKVSSEAEYRFRVEDDITLIAKFVSNTPASVGEVEEKEDDNNGWIIALAVIAAILFVAGVVGIVVVSAGKKETDSDENNEYIGNDEEFPDIPGNIPMNIVMCTRCGIPHPSNRPCKCYEEQNREQITEEAQCKSGIIQITNGSMRGFAVPIRDKETLYLGKDAKICNVVFTNDYTSVSRMHCSVTFDDANNKYYVVDNSSNGTYLIGKKRLVKGKRTAVNVNTVLLLANEQCTVLLG